MPRCRSISTCTVFLLTTSVVACNGSLETSTSSSEPARPSGDFASAAIDPEKAALAHRPTLADIELVRSVRNGPKMRIHSAGGATETLASRSLALTAMLTRLKAVQGLDRTKPSGKQKVIQTAFDNGGRVRGLWAFNEEGLTTSVANDPLATVEQFVAENAGLYDLQGSSYANSRRMPWLTKPKIENLTFPNGKQMTNVTYAQYYRGLPVLNAPISAQFSGGRLVSFQGRVFNPGEEIVDTVPHVSAAQALASVKMAISRQTKVPVDMEAPILGIDEDGVLIYEFISTGKSGSNPVVPAYVARVDANSGSVIYAQPDKADSPSTPGTYRVRFPVSDESDPLESIVLSNRTGLVTAEGDSRFPFQDVVSNRSSLPVYNAQSFIGSTTGFDLHSTPNPNFLWDPPHVFFASQHASYWLQIASDLVDVGMMTIPPANLGYRFKKITSVASCPSVSSFASNCATIGYPNLFRSSDANTGCICLSSDSVNGGYPDNVATAIDTIFHEFGHSVDWKYLGGEFRRNPHKQQQTCLRGSSDEASSLGEGIASLYSLIAFTNVYGISSTFTDYNAVRRSGTGIHAIETLAADAGLGNGSVPVHTSNENILCYADPSRPSCDSADYRDKYAYATPLLQAFWESIHNVNCFNSPCVSLDNETQVTHLFALLYALKTTQANANYTAFVANLLTYYYNSVGYDQWNNRWWIFNHHRLVGPNYGYSPCHAY